MIDNEILETPEINEQSEETSATESVEIPIVAKSSPVETDMAANFRKLRESKEQIERERDEYKRMIMQSSQPKQEAQPEEDLEVNIDPDALAEGKHLAKLAKKYKKLEEKFDAYQKKSKEDNIEVLIKSQYPDFNTIVNDANLAHLRETYPELAHTLNTSSDLYSKAVSAYTLIKKLGIQTESYDMEKEKVTKNINKPRPMAAISPQQGDSPLTKANAFAGGLTKELKDQLHKEMLDAMKQSY